MESIKKILPYLLVAIVFALGGYFVGQGSFGDDQSASFFKSQLLIKDYGVQVIETEGCWTNGEGNTYLYHNGVRIAGPCPQGQQNIHSTGNAK